MQQALPDRIMLRDHLLTSGGFRGAGGAIPAGTAVLEAVPLRDTSSHSSLRRIGRIGSCAVVMAVIALMSLVGFTQIAGAVVSGGILVVDSGAKQVQHLTGGVVSKVLVKNGDRVAADQVLLFLDDTTIKMRLSSAFTQLLQNQARLARLLAERDGLEGPNFDQLTSSNDIHSSQRAAIIASEVEQFRLRQEELAGQLDELDQRIAQVSAEQEASQSELVAVQQQIGMTERQLADLRKLYETQLVSGARLSEFERSLAQLQGSEGRLESAISASKAKDAEFRVMKVQTRRTWRSEVAEQIVQTQSEVTSLLEEVAVLGDQLERLVIRAPQDGVISDLAALTRGAVVGPGEKVMLVVPDKDDLVAQVRIRPSDIDQVYPGQAVTIQFSAFDRSTTPSVQGRLAEISPDLTEDARNGALYYEGRVAIEDLATISDGGVRLVPGMPVEVFIRTDDRTILSYLLKPLSDQINRAFR